MAQFENPNPNPNSDPIESAYLPGGLGFDVTPGPEGPMQPGGPGGLGDETISIGPPIDAFNRETNSYIDPATGEPSADRGALPTTREFAREMDGVRDRTSIGAMNAPRTIPGSIAGRNEANAIAANREDQALLGARMAQMRAIQSQASRNYGNHSDSIKEIRENRGLIPELFATIMGAGEMNNQQNLTDVLLGKTLYNLLEEQNLDSMSEGLMGLPFSAIGTRLGQTTGFDDEAGVYPTPAASATLGAINPVLGLTAWATARYFGQPKSDDVLLGEGGDTRADEKPFTSMNRIVKNLQRETTGGGQSIANVLWGLADTVGISTENRAPYREELFGPDGVIDSNLMGHTTYLSSLKMIKDGGIIEKFAERMMGEQHGVGWEGANDDSRKENVNQIVKDLSDLIFDAYAKDTETTEVIRKGLNKAKKIGQKYEGSERSTTEQLYREFYTNLLGHNFEKGVGDIGIQGRKESVEQYIARASAGTPEQQEDFRFAVQAVSQVFNHMGRGMRNKYLAGQDDAWIRDNDGYRAAANVEGMSEGQIRQERLSIQRQHQSAAAAASGFHNLHSSYLAPHSVSVNDYGHFLEKLGETMDIYGDPQTGWLSDPQQAAMQMTRLRKRIINQDDKWLKTLEGMGYQPGTSRFKEIMDTIAPSEEQWWDYYHKQRRTVESIGEGESIYLQDPTLPWHRLVQQVALTERMQSLKGRWGYEGLPASEEARELEQSLRYLKETKKEIGLEQMVSQIRKKGERGLKPVTWEEVEKIEDKLKKGER